MRKYPIIICLIITLLLNTNIQSLHVDESISASEPIASSDSIVSDWMQELQEHEPFEIFSDADFVDQGWLGNGSESNPFIIEGIMIRAPFSSIFIWNTTKHFEIRRCYFTFLTPSTGGPALLFRNVTNGRVTSCFINETHYGILVRNSTDCEVTDNILSGNFFEAIFTEGGQDVLIVNNIIYDTGSGISMIETTDFTIRDNRIYDCSRGLRLIDVQFCTILENTVWKNSVGIDLTRANSTITNNSIYGNTDIGIRINTGIASTMVYGNRIGWNGVQNAEDNSNATGWDDELGTGNSWSDYNGTGQYPIPGSATSYDQWPLILVDNEVPVVDTLIDVDFEFGCLGKAVSWTTSDEFPLMYQIMNGGSQIETGTWSGQVITFLLDDLQSGTHSLSLLLWDAQGNYAADGVIIQISEAQPPVINYPPDIEYVVGDFGYNITWIPEDAYPESYEIFINEILYESGDWNGSEILVFVDGHDIGVYNYTLAVYDSLGQTSTDVVLVRVLAHTSEPPPSNSLTYILIIVSIVSVIIIISAVILIRLHKKPDPEKEPPSEESTHDKLPLE